MTTAAPAEAVSATFVPDAGHRPGFGHLLAAEWTKIRSVRSTFWTIIAFVIVTIGFTALITWAIEANWNGPHAAARDASFVSNPVASMLGVANFLGQLVIGVLGVLVITSEYSTGVIRSSLLAVPRRLHMLAAKAVVFTMLLIVMAEIVTFCSFFIGTAIMHAHVPVALSDHNVTRAVIGIGLYLTVVGLFSLGIGGIIRHTAGAIATTLGTLFVLPIVGPLLPSSWGAHINSYLPVQAGSDIGNTTQSSSQLLSAWQGFGVLCIWAALALAVAAFLLRKRDA